MNVGVLALVGSLAAGGPPGPVPGMRPPGGVGGMPGPMLQYPHPGMGLPVPAPVLPAKVLAPEGVRVAAYPGSRIARLYDTPAVLAFRPAYTYRLELAN